VRFNCLTLDAMLIARGDVRHTPAGLPALDLELGHESTQIEAGSDRRVTCELAAVALGALAQRLAQVQVGGHIRCSGFLARRYRTGASVALHVIDFEAIDADTASGTVSAGKTAAYEPNARR